MKKVLYICNLCGKERGKDYAYGVNVTSTGGIQLTKPATMDKVHICKPCFASLMEERHSIQEGKP